MPNLKLPARASLKSWSKSYPILNVQSIDWNPIKEKNKLSFSSKCRVSGGETLLENAQRGMEACQLLDDRVLPYMVHRCAEQ